MAGGVRRSSKAHSSGCFAKNFRDLCEAYAGFTPGECPGKGILPTALRCCEASWKIVRRALFRFLSNNFIKK